MNRTTLISALAVAALAIGGIVWVSTSSGTTETAETSAEAPITDIQDMAIGNPDAPVKLTEYASYTCGHCAAFHTQSFKQLKADYIDTGKVYFTYREVYFDRAALWASMVSRCGGQEKFFGISDLIFKGLQDWAGENDPVKMADGLRKIGRISGLSTEQVDACLEDEEKAKSLVAWYQQNAEADGVDSTPTFIINGSTKISGNNPVALKDALNKAMAE